MADKRIVREDLWNQLVNIQKKEVWIRAASELGLRVTMPKGGSSHVTIRFPGFENWDMKGVVSTVYDPMRKDISEAVFKKLLDKGYNEDDIWKALKLL